MIIKMSKIEMVGPKDQLMDVLELLRNKGVFHPDAEVKGYVHSEDEARIRGLLLNEEAVGEKIFFDKLRIKIIELLNCLPEVPSRTVYLHPIPIIDVLQELVEKHLETCREWQQQCHALRENMDALGRYLRFWSVLEPMVREVNGDSGLKFFGVTIRSVAEIDLLRKALETQTRGRCRLSTENMDDGTIVGLITTDPEMENSLRQLLSAERVPELALPEEFANLPFWEKSSALKRQLEEVSARLSVIERKQQEFSRHWLPIYRRTLDWLEERLALYQATASAYETRQCFVIHGWMASGDVAELRRELNSAFSGKVLTHELEIHQEELDRVPVIMHNPLYFKPFELFARILPLPKYSSYDPTPFLGIFFPLLFGMILGDIGYGLILGLIAALLIYFFPQRNNLCDGAKILGVSAAYATIFGILYGELFGDLGHHLFNLQPIWVERSQAIVPLICFALSVGTAHVLFGLGLGIRYDVKRKRHREALVKAINLLVIFIIGFSLIGTLVPHPWSVTMPLLATLLLLVPILILAGGLLAPLELLKNFGNIISYMRIMAIGLCSVLLADVANRLGGMTGNVIAGFLVAGVLHFFNLLLGVFSPTVHALRLHYVEFFSKFLEFGGRRFEPLSKKPK
ncbi:MAG: ATPase [Desulfuromonas sp.]|nr:MAG: ATPase [Desulfuromonas sp.]